MVLMDLVVHQVLPDLADQADLPDLADLQVHQDQVVLQVHQVHQEHLLLLVVLLIYLLNLQEPVLQLVILNMTYMRNLLMVLYSLDRHLIQTLLHMVRLLMPKIT